MRSTPSIQRRSAGLLLVLLIATACSREQGGSGKSVILNRGSDTMLNVAQAWAEDYARVEPDVSIEVAGGGSGVGIAALIDGTVELANSSRPLKDGEIEKATQQRGAAPTQFVAGYDALAVYVHESNPVDRLTLAQIAGIYADNGAINGWSDLGVRHPGCPRDTVVRISRQSSSGTYDFFREIALDKHDFKLGTLELNGSKEVVELVSHTPCAIGYSGMGYNAPGVRMVAIARDDQHPYVSPTVSTTLDQTYPIARPLYMFTIGEPLPHTRRYIDWILSDEGQAIVGRVGYVPLRRVGARPS